MRLQTMPKYYFRATPQLKSGPLPAHIDTPDNNADTPFDFTTDEYKLIEKILAKYPLNYKQSGVIPLLYIAQSHCGVCFFVFFASFFFNGFVAFFFFVCVFFTKNRNRKIFFFYGKSKLETKTHLFFLFLFYV